jgi:hypothetical protein
MKIGEVAPPQLRDGLRRMENTFCSSYPALAPQRGTRLGGVPGYYRSSWRDWSAAGLSVVARLQRGRSSVNRTRTPDTRRFAGCLFIRAEATRDGSPAGLPRGGSARGLTSAQAQPRAAVVHEFCEGQLAAVLDELERGIGLFRNGFGGEEKVE